LSARFEFWNLSLSLVFVRATDAYLTYTITPDLSFEANPLVAIANQGWTTLFWVNIVVVLLSIFLLYLSIYYPSDSYPKERNYSFQEFISHYLYNDRFSFHKIYFLVPDNKKAILSFCGFIFPRVFISWSIIIIIHNFSIIHFDLYLYYINFWNLWLYIYTFLIPLTLFYFWQFFKVEYRKYILASTELD
jgi:hypothetical protein